MNYRHYVQDKLARKVAGNDISKELATLFVRREVGRFKLLALTTMGEQNQVDAIIRVAAKKVLYETL